MPLFTPAQQVRNKPVTPEEVQYNKGWDLPPEYFINTPEREKLAREMTNMFPAVPEGQRMNRNQFIGLLGGLAAMAAGPLSVPSLLLGLSSGVIGGFGDYQMYKENPKTITPLNVLGSATGVASVGRDLFTGVKTVSNLSKLTKASRLGLIKNQEGKLYGIVNPGFYDIHGFKGVPRTPFKVFEDPTTSEFHKIMKESSRNIEGLDGDTPIRGVRVAVTPDGKVWAWDALAGLHGETIDLIYGKGTARSAFGSAMAREEILDPSEWSTFLERLPEIKKSVKWDYETRPSVMRDSLSNKFPSPLKYDPKQRGSILPVSAAPRLGLVE